MDRQRLLAVARGAEPGDLLLAGGRVVNVFTSEIEVLDVVIAEGRVAGVGPGYSASETVRLDGAFVVPGLINGHTHVESSFLAPPQYTRTAVSHGTTSVVTDLHELANVGGLPAIRAYLDEARDLPLDVFLMVPSCVPASGAGSGLETSGAVLSVREVGRALDWPEAIGLGELMNFPGAIAGRDDCLDKVREALVRGKLVDGHAPRLSGAGLNAYLAAGPRSDHETTSLEEGREKLRRGIHLMIREGTSEKNLEDLLPLVTDDTYPRCLLVVDDRSCRDLLHDGDMDAVVRKAVSLGLDPVRAVQLATINPATYFRLSDRGAVAPGYVANIVVVDDLRDFRPRLVCYEGRLVARDGQALFPTAPGPTDHLRDTVRVAPLPANAFRIAATAAEVAVVEVIPYQIVTRKLMLRPTVRGGEVVADPARDILKGAAIERHAATGNVGVGLVRGFGLKRGAMATSFDHDSHNIVVVGTNDADMRAAVEEVIRLGGGLTVVADRRPLASLALPIAGLMSPEPLEDVSERLDAVERAAASLGASIHAPFAVLSFLALPVIPELRITDRGVVDVERMALVTL